MPKPVPVPDELSKPFWDACNERRLAVQHCKVCRRFQHPPKKACDKCGSEQDLEFKQVSGRGTVYSYTVMHDTRIRALQPDQPYNIVVVQLEEDAGINMSTNLPGTPVDEVPIGAKVQVEFVEAAPGRLVPEFRVVS